MQDIISPPTVMRAAVSCTSMKMIKFDAFGTVRFSKGDTLPNVSVTWTLEGQGLQRKVVSAYQSQSFKWCTRSDVELLGVVLYMFVYIRNNNRTLTGRWLLSPMKKFGPTECLNHTNKTKNKAHVMRWFNRTGNKQLQRAQERGENEIIEAWSFQKPLPAV